MSSPKPPRYVALDSYRFLAASGVVLYHYNADFRLGLESGSRLVENLGCMVDFFFVLSGFVIAQGYRDRLGTMREYALFLRARLARLYPLHALILAAYLLLAAVAWALRVQPNHPEILAMSGLPANLALVQAWGVLDHPSFNVPSWSISAEWFVYLLAPAILMIVRRTGLGFSLLFAGMLIVAMIAVRRSLGAQDWMESTYQFGMLRAVPSFLAGAAIAEAMRAGRLRGRPSWWLVHLLAAGVLVVLSLDVPREMVLPLFCLLVASVALADVGGEASLLKSRVLRHLGDCSYALYMCHVLVSVPFLFAARHLQLLAPPWSFAFACASFAVSIGLSLLSYRYFEQPVRRWLTAGSAGPRSGLAAPPVPAATRGG